jgi:hypothetical protein
MYGAFVLSDEHCERNYVDGGAGNLKSEIARDQVTLHIDPRDDKSAGSERANQEQQ